VDDDKGRRKRRKRLADFIGGGKGREKGGGWRRSTGGQPTRFFSSGDFGGRSAQGRGSPSPNRKEERFVWGGREGKEGEEPEKERIIIGVRSYDSRKTIEPVPNLFVDPAVDAGRISQRGRRRGKPTLRLRKGKKRREGNLRKRFGDMSEVEAALRGSIPSSSILAYVRPVRPSVVGREKGKGR